MRHQVIDGSSRTDCLFEQLQFVRGTEYVLMDLAYGSCELLKLKDPIPFRFNGKGALIDNDYKLVATSIGHEKFELYDLRNDPKESKDILYDNLQVFKRMRSIFKKWNASVNASVGGRGYPEAEIYLGEPERQFWMTDERYTPFLFEWRKLPEYATSLKAKGEKARRKRD